MMSEYQRLGGQATAFGTGIAFDALSDGYDDEFKGPLFLAEDDVLFAYMRKLGFGERGKRVLDIGCGTGLALERMEWAADQYIGVDISKGMLTKAREKFPRHMFKVGDAAGMVAIPTASVDLVVSTYGSLSYVPQIGAALSEVHRTLRPGGRFFLMLFGPRYAHRETHICEKHKLPVQFHMLPAYIMRALADGTGFRNVKIEGFHALPDAMLASGTREGIRTILAAERLVTKYLPDLCYFHIITGAK